MTRSNIKFKSYQSSPKGVQKRSQQNTPVRNSTTPLLSTASPMRLAALSNIALGSPVGVPIRTPRAPTSPSLATPSQPPISSTTPSVSAPSILPSITTPRSRSNPTVFDFHMEMFATTVTGAAMSTTSPAPTPRRRTADERRVSQVLDALETSGLSLQKFLVTIANSKDKEITMLANRFYSHCGPAAVVRSWGNALRNKSYDYSFIEGAVEVIGSRVQTDLNRVANKKGFKHPSTSISRKKIHNFSMNRLKNSFEASAPTLTLVLKVMIPKKNIAIKKADSISTDNTQNARDSYDTSQLHDPAEALPPRHYPDVPLPLTQGVSSVEEEEVEEVEPSDPSELDSDLGSDSGNESDWGMGADSDSSSGSAGKAMLNKDQDFTTNVSANAGDAIGSAKFLNSSYGMDTDSEMDISLDEEGQWQDIEEADHSMPKRQRMKKELDPDPGSFVATVGSMLAYMKSHKSNYLQMMMGLHLRGLSCPKQLINLLHVMGLSMSYATTTRALKALAGDHFRVLRRVARLSPIFFLYDNFNQARRVRHQTKDHQASFLSGTTATVVVGEDIGEELSSMEKVPNTLVVDIKLTEDDTKHFKVVYRHHLFKALQPTLNKGPLFKALAIPPIKVLISRPTEAYELAAMEIDQSTVSGNMAVLEEMRRVLDLDKELFKEMKMILAGDHLSVSRLRALMSRKSDDTTFFDRLSWAIPVLQLFHMQMLLCTSILRTHFGGDGLKPGSLRYYKVMLDRKGLDDEKPSHHLADEFLRTVFTAMARRMWQTKQESSTQHSETSSNDIFLSEINNLVDRILLVPEYIYDSYSTINGNALIFIRDMVVYLEFCSAIKDGDVGRIEEILKRITIMLQSGKHSHYALELLRLRFNIQHRWSENRKNAIFSSLLMNTKGLPHRWIPSDMYQFTGKCSWSTS
ncbi:hypothetical protein K457DRAFT_1860583 [Linnemannia elongata AG-77]|uniref:DUF6589 domain-containing protein n=1 Tax=Linnemannia elongata AG-77 TaxID=1314771 RepID=A0A197KBV4_9FUNG|nr:hypothetical protein K457DRAFT_1860583 [Linnemannia elongata AG-77]